MNINDFKTVQIGNRKICIAGIGKMFYQDGFPISMAVSFMKEKGIEVSIFHVADECLKNGWSAETTFNKLKADFEDDIERNEYNLSELERFCYTSYEKQRDLIFQYLFNNDKELAKEWTTSAL